MKTFRRTFGPGGAIALAALALILLPSLAPAQTLGSSGLLGEPIITGAKMPGDFNEDGKPDLLFQNAATGNLAVWLMSGTKPSDRVAIVQTVDASFLAAGTDDFDGDLSSDVLFYGARDGTLVVWHMKGVDLLYKTQIEGSYKEYVPVSLFDYDRDGNTDILFQHRANSGMLFVLLLRGTDVVGKVALTLPSADPFVEWRVAGTADFDRDGDADLVLHRHATAIETGNAWADVLALAFMDGSVGEITVITQVGDRNWMLRGVSDWSADGWPDLMWENAVTGDAGVWEMQGPKVLAQYVIGSEPTINRGWHIVGPR